MTSILKKRIRNLEEHVTSCKIPEKERFVVISYPDGNVFKRDLLLQEQLTKLRDKYGTEISEKDLFVVAIRKFGTFNCKPLHP